ncbi:hypothetical protein KY290_036002 [Solanum tuberosum]|uniref:F-box domain-containing protein n=1 Tax=Solanum tuberosum TaxID=4113 RepID=A0ABQ7TT25_SOLTU|nr:hypothetical protein KY290_036002 [Solanum tuberosum]
MADWPGLPHDLLVLIAKRVKVIEDFIAFRSVCTSWRTASPKDNFDIFSPQLPLLMLPDDDENNYYREFYSLSKGKVSQKLYLPEAKGRECFPSHQVGWLLTQSFDGENVNLFNPFSRTQIQLPNQFALIDEDEELIEQEEYNYIRNAILSANPSFTSDYVLVIAYNTDVNHLAFWRPGDINWNKFRIGDRVGGVSDMIYFKGQFYLVTWSGALGIIDIQGPNSVPESNIIYLNDDKKLFRQHSTQFYLVDINDALLLVTRFGRRRSNASRALETVKFEVYELDVVKGSMKEINNLGDSTIFVGCNGATCIDSTKFTGVIKPNHIYFTDDWFDQNYHLECGGGKDMGCYNIQDGNIESFYPELSLSHICPPTWVIPSL